MDICISLPTKIDYIDILSILKKIADESNEFTFTSEDLGMDKNMFGEYIEKFFLYENSIFLIARYKDELAGFAYLEGGKRARTFHSASLGIGILKKFRGIGIGKLLIKELLDFATNSRYIAKIDLQVKLDNKVAINLYKSFGFNIEGINKRAIYINGRFIDYANMGLIVD